MIFVKIRNLSKIFLRSFENVGPSSAIWLLASMCLRAVGSVIRCMRRLEEALREMCQAAKTIGNTQLENKFSEGRFDCCNILLL